MALLKANLSPIGGQSSRGSAPSVFAYKTADTHATVDTTGYFNGVSELLEVGDLLEVVVVTNLGLSTEAVATYGRHIVLSNAAGVVDVSNVAVGVVTDTD